MTARPSGWRARQKVEDRGLKPDVGVYGYAVIHKAPVEFITGLRMFGLKLAKTRAQGSIETAAAGMGKLSSMIKSRWVAMHRFIEAAVPTVPKALGQLPGFKPNIRNPLFRFT